MVFPRAPPLPKPPVILAVFSRGHPAIPLFFPVVTPWWVPPSIPRGIPPRYPRVTPSDTRGISTWYSPRSTHIPVDPLA